MHVAPAKVNRTLGTNAQSIVTLADLHLSGADFGTSRRDAVPLFGSDEAPRHLDVFDTAPEDISGMLGAYGHDDMRAAVGAAGKAILGPVNNFGSRGTDANGAVCWPRDEGEMFAKDTRRRQGKTSIGSPGSLSAHAQIMLVRA